MRIYFLGIAGTAMGNAALLLRDLGHEVMGSDQAVYPPMSDYLAEAGIAILEGYDAERLADLNPDLVVVGNAFSRGNVEVEYLLDSQSVPYASLPETISRFALRKRNNIVVTGTHGKTTTTALAAFLLEQAETDPGYLIGGAPLDPEKGWRNGSSESPFVIEGDEYDSAFFDKRSKFIHYRPGVLVLNNLEFDHADIFRDLDDVKRAFSHLLRIVPQNGWVLVNGDDEHALSLLPVGWTQVLQVGLAADSDLRIEHYKTERNGSSFDLIWRGREWLRINWSLAGLFNARNAAMACLAAALSLSEDGNPLEFKAIGIESFRGVKRRQQVRLEKENLLVVEDFAHHPTAIKEILKTLKSQHPDYRIIAAFEPRSNTSRLEIMREPLSNALSVSDLAIIGAPKRRSSESVEILDTNALVSMIEDKEGSAIACQSNDDVLDALAKDQEKNRGVPTLVAFLTNGSFGGVIDRFIEDNS